MSLEEPSHGDMAAAVAADAGIAESVAMLGYVKDASPYGLPPGWCVVWTDGRGHRPWSTPPEEGGGGILWVPQHYTDAQVRLSAEYWELRGLA